MSFFYCIFAKIDIIRPALCSRSFEVDLGSNSRQHRPCQAGNHDLFMVVFQPKPKIKHKHEDTTTRTRVGTL